MLKVSLHIFMSAGERVSLAKDKRPVSHEETQMHKPSGKNITVVNSN